MATRAKVYGNSILLETPDSKTLTQISKFAQIVETDAGYTLVYSVGGESIDIATGIMQPSAMDFKREVKEIYSGRPAVAPPAGGGLRKRKTRKLRK